MVLGNERILKERQRGNILIEPFNETLLQGGSYDVRLDKYFVLPFTPVDYEKKMLETLKGKKYLEIYSPAINEFYKMELSFFYKDFEKYFTTDYYLPENSNKINHKVISAGFILPPKMRILASTIEQIGSNSLEITTQMHARSTTGRHGLEVCGCAGWGDRYANHWTKEIFNKNEYPVLLEHGMVLGQISFSEIDGCSKLYISKYNNFGQGGNHTSEQRFEMMLPKPIRIIAQ